MPFNELVGKTLTKVTGMEKGAEEIRFYTEDGKVYRMYHDQDCCEYVSVEDVHGFTEEILNTPIRHAQETTNSDRDLGEMDEKEKSLSERIDPPMGDDSFTWTYYFISTDKGSLSIRWYGSSNGYYSESVDFHEEGKSKWD